MPVEPGVKRAVAFIDGQNLYHAARDAFGYTYPNYDVQALSRKVCEGRGWQLQQTRFYTGVPDERDDSFWNHFWMKKLAMMGRQNVVTYWRHLRYRNHTIRLPDGTEHSYLAAEEKGIDVRIALDVIGIRLAHRSEYDVALVFSQDQDLSEVADELRVIAREQNRWIKMASAFPASLLARNPRGVNGTDWIKIERAMYQVCLDERDYRPKADKVPR
ncbi:MAG: NYN domain-containing protein [Deltaproteobacteria bacterium]|nr:NYN domain-containing protein [Deltaproteobacteria bacterium]